MNTLKTLAAQAAILFGALLSAIFETLLIFVGVVFASVFALIVLPIIHVADIVGVAKNKMMLVK